MATLELGGGTNPLPDADVVIDLHHPRNSPHQDAAVIPWAFFTGESIPNNHFDRVYCSHFLEHIPSGQSRINVLNEAWRVLRTGGVFDMVVPLVGYTDPNSGNPMSNHIGWQPFADPTHVSFWWFPESLLYFCEGPFKPNADYGFSTWKPMGAYCLDPFTEEMGGWTVVNGWEGKARIVKP